MKKGWDLIHRKRSPFPKGKANFIRNFALKSLKNIDSEPHCTSS